MRGFRHAAADIAVLPLVADGRRIATGLHGLHVEIREARRLASFPRHLAPDGSFSCSELPPKRNEAYRDVTRRLDRES